MWYFAASCIKTSQETGEKSAPHQEVFPPMGCVLDSVWLQFTSALRVFITALPTMKNHLYKSFSLPLSHTKLISLKPGGILPVAWDNTICFQMCSWGNNVKISGWIREIHVRSWARDQVQHHLVCIILSETILVEEQTVSYSSEGLICSRVYRLASNVKWLQLYWERSWIWTKSSLLASGLFACDFLSAFSHKLSCTFITVYYHLEMTLLIIFLIRSQMIETQKSPGWFKAPLHNIFKSIMC